MRIVFICSSLEPGKDGVGDYTRKLSCELVRQMHDVQIIALSDKHLITKNSKTETQVDDNTSISVLRLSTRFAWRNRILASKQFIDRCQPQWISLQYVPYGFHKKGLPFELALNLKKLGGQYKWHIMFHELWVGIKKDSPLSHTFFKILQVGIVKHLCNVLKPSLVCTSNIIYFLELKSKHIESKITPLFSNITKCQFTTSDKNSLKAELNIHNKDLDTHYFIGVFGSLHNLKQVINTLYRLANDQSLKTTYILFFGKHGTDKKGICESLNNEHVRLHFFDEVDEKKASSILQILNVAVSSTPFEYIGKSGAYAAYKLHNIPVQQSGHISIPQYSEAINEFNEYLENRPSAEWDVSRTAKDLSYDLSLHSDL